MESYKACCDPNISETTTFWALLTNRPCSLTTFPARAPGFGAELPRHAAATATSMSQPDPDRRCAPIFSAGSAYITLRGRPTTVTDTLDNTRESPSTGVVLVCYSGVWLRAFMLGQRLPLQALHL